MNLVNALSRHGVSGVASRAWRRLVLRPWYGWRWRRAPHYRSPDARELAQIAAELEARGVRVHDLRLEPADFRDFQERFRFPADYHGGRASGVWDEKLLEHFIAWRLAGLDRPDAGPYVDVAACGSPWARMLREHGIEAYAIDLAVPAEYRAVPYYLQRDAAVSGFDDASMGAASLQCAFEMFAGEDDRRLLTECARILRSGGRVVIAPLYLHTHHCGYASPDFYGRAPADAGARLYLRTDTWAVPFSRKYSASLLQERVLTHASRLGLVPQLYRLANPGELGDGIYCHFILVLQKR